MKIEPRETKVRDLTADYQDNNEAGVALRRSRRLPRRKFAAAAVPAKLITPRSRVRVDRLRRTASSQRGARGEGFEVDVTDFAYAKHEGHPSVRSCPETSFRQYAPVVWVSRYDRERFACRAARQVATRSTQAPLDLGGPSTTRGGWIGLQVRAWF